MMMKISSVGLRDDPVSSKGKSESAIVNLELKKQMKSKRMGSITLISLYIWKCFIKLDHNLLLQFALMTSCQGFWISWKQFKKKLL